MEHFYYLMVCFHNFWSHDCWPLLLISNSWFFFSDGLSMITADISKLFTEISHHYKSSIFFIGQNLFYDNKDFRNLALNTHYLFLMKVSGNIQIISIRRLKIMMPWVPDWFGCLGGIAGGIGLFGHLLSVPWWGDPDEILFSLSLADGSTPVCSIFRA